MKAHSLSNIRKRPLTDEQIAKVINNQIKKLEESLSFFKKGKREDLIKKTKAEIKILKVYLPRQLSDEELGAKIEKIFKQNPSVSHPGALIRICIRLWLEEPLTKESPKWS